jgi:hypothetical protein
MSNAPVYATLTILLSGCATLFASHTAQVSFGSDPAGADVLVDGSRVATTPGTVELASNKSHVVTLRKAGYQDATCTLNTNVGAGWIVLDVLGGLVPVVIDAATSNWNGLSTKVCNQNLAPIPSPAQ